jgi:hypothetical protein
MFHRTRPKAWALFDLALDPHETANRIATEPAIVERHLQRIRALNASLHAEPTADDEQTDEDRARLRALGYLADEP